MLLLKDAVDVFPALYYSHNSSNYSQLYYFNSQSTIYSDATYTAPTALMVIELMAAQLGSRQVPVDVLWQAVLGVTYQYQAGHLPEDLYGDYCQFLKVKW